MNDALLFRGQVTGVKQEVNKGGYGNTGSLTLNLTIKQPVAPRQPRPDYIVFDDLGEGVWKPRPADVKRKAKETDEAWAKRETECRQAQAAYDCGVQLYREATERFSGEWAKFEKALRDYAWVAGFAGVLGAQEVEVSIAPLNREFLTFERPALIPLPAQIETSPVGNSEAGAGDAEAPGAEDRESAPPPAPTDGPIIGDGGVLLCPGCMHPCTDHEEPGTPFGGCAWCDPEKGEICDCELMWKVEGSDGE